MSVTIKNAKVTWSNMRNKMTPDLLSREFCIELPSDSPEITKLCADFKELEKKAKETFGEKVGKKVKGASTEKGLGASLFTENEYKPGYTRLKFTIYNINEREFKLEDGTVTKKRVETLSPIYKDLDWCYKINNNGAKEYTIPDRDTHWLPLSGNLIDVKCSLRASYNKSDNRVTIRLKADDVNILQASEFNKSGGFLTLDGDDEVPVKVEKASVKTSDDMFEEDDMSKLDL